MAFILPPLPFENSAIEPFLSAESFDFHYGKHHQAYVDKVNGWIGEKEGLAGKSLIEIIKLAKATADMPLFNNAAQVWNHSFFWQCLAPAGTTRPSDKLARLIDTSFGSPKQLADMLAAQAVAHFGSGWAWLVLDGDSLKITSLHDADTPIVNGLVPLLTLDVWEHAYYIDYRNARPKFAQEVIAQVINWDFVSKNLDGLGTSRADQNQ
jgi:Fe-Mn family superoxide dismutase